MHEVDKTTRESVHFWFGTLDYLCGSKGRLVKADILELFEDAEAVSRQTRTSLSTYVCAPVYVVGGIRHQSIASIPQAAYSRGLVQGFLRHDPNHPGIIDEAWNQIVDRLQVNRAVATQHGLCLADFTNPIVLPVAGTCVWGRDCLHMYGGIPSMPTNLLYVTAQHKQGPSSQP